MYLQAGPTAYSKQTIPSIHEVLAHLEPISPVDVLRLAQAASTGMHDTVWDIYLARKSDLTWPPLPPPTAPLPFVRRPYDGQEHLRGNMEPKTVADGPKMGKQGCPARLESDSSSEGKGGSPDGRG